MREGVTQENAAIGETTNLVARLQAIAEPNSVVISPVTYHLVGALFDYRDLGRHSLKGFSEPVQVRQVLGPSKVESRFEAQHQAGTSPLLGREEELGLLVRRWGEAKRGEGRVVLLTGEPGIGKSRLTSALREHLRSAPHTPLSYFCSPLHQGSALYPFIGQINRAAGIERDDSAEDKLEKLQSLLAQSNGNLAENLPLFAALLAIPTGDRYPSPEMTPQRRKERTLSALLDQLRPRASLQPVLMVFEDLHWIDPTSLELLSRAIEQIGDEHILLLATARPEFAPPWPNHRHTCTLSLNRLGRSDGEALITGIAKGKRLPTEVCDQIIARTDGVPLFVEELTKTVLESGLLREGEDDFELTGPLPPLAIPSTLHASLLARLDNDAPPARPAYVEALNHLERGLALVGTLPESAGRDRYRYELGFLLALRHPSQAVHGYSYRAFEDRFERATVLAETLGDMGQLFTSLQSQWVYCNSAGKTRKGLEFAERCRTLAERQGDRWLQIWGYLCLGQSLLLPGEFALSRKHIERAQALYDHEHDRSMPYATNPLAVGSAFLALAQWILGYPDRAADMRAHALRYAAELNHPLTLSCVHYHTTELAQLSGNAAAVLDLTQTLVALREEHGIRTFNGAFYQAGPRLGRATPRAASFSCSRALIE
jgi:hypothetical protein